MLNNAYLTVRQPYMIRTLIMDRWRLSHTLYFLKEC